MSKTGGGAVGEGEDGTLSCDLKRPRKQPR